jgi:hypothetical protein
MEYVYNARVSRRSVRMQLIQECIYEDVKSTDVARRTDELSISLPVPLTIQTAPPPQKPATPQLFGALPAGHATLCKVPRWCYEGTEYKLQGSEYKPFPREQAKGWAVEVASNAAYISSRYACVMAREEQVGVCKQSVTQKVKETTPLVLAGLLEAPFGVYAIATVTGLDWIVQATLTSLCTILMVSTEIFVHAL